MATRCYGCMKMAQQSPCEHCGWEEGQNNLSHQLPVGTVLRGQYEVGRCLGQGGFGITYLGWDRALDTRVAIKEYYPNSLVSRESHVSLSVTAGGSESFEHNKKRFLQEARTLARLGDIPGTVNVYNLFEENDTAYFVMEYVEGMDLRRYVQSFGGKLGTAVVFAILKPVMEALEKVHGAGLVHRDISPDNIMIRPDGTAKLLDFGAVREVLDAGAKKELAQSTEAILKHGFAPMEQYQKRGSLGPWTDVYALCATIYYCLTGKTPPDAPGRMMDEIDLGWDKIPGLTENQRQALEKGMALMPKDRTASVTELYRGIYGESTTTPIMVTQAVKDIPVYEGKPRTKQAQTPEKPKARGKGKFLVAVFLLLLGLLAYGLLQRGKPEAAVATAPEDLVNFLIVCREEGSTDYSASTMLLLTLNKQSKWVHATSILTDTWVDLPAVGEKPGEPGTIGRAYHLGFLLDGTGTGLDAAEQAIRDNFGIQVDYSLELKPQGVVSLVNLLGGIEIRLTEEEVTAFQEAQAGLVTLDGTGALAYMRLGMEENSLSSRIQRSSRQRNVVQALLDRIRDRGIGDIQQMASELMPYFYTDMSGEDVVACMWDLMPVLPIQGYSQGTCPAEGTYRENSVAVEDQLRQVLDYDKEKNQEAMAIVTGGLS